MSAAEDDSEIEAFRQAGFHMIGIYEPMSDQEWFAAHPDRRYRLRRHPDVVRMYPDGGKVALLATDSNGIQTAITDGDVVELALVHLVGPNTAQTDLIRFARGAVDMEHVIANATDEMLAAWWEESTKLSTSEG